jgi:hypothetical protein
MQQCRYFPSVKVASEMATLREELGLPGVEWAGFMHV